MKIFKYPLQRDFNIQHVHMFKGAVILKVTMWEGVPTMWVLSDPQEFIVTRTFLIVGTGEEIHPKNLYIGTCFEEPLVWHIIEVFDPLKYPGSLHREQVSRLIQLTVRGESY